MIALANPEITRRIEEGNKKGTRKISLGDPFDDGAGEFIHTGWYNNLQQERKKRLGQSPS